MFVSLAWISAPAARIFLPLCVLMLSACGAVGDASAIREANKHAIACETEAAFDALDRAAQAGGMMAEVAGLERVVLLRDAGRMDEAAAALEARNARAAADEAARAEAEAAIEESLEALRDERQAQTGRRTCS